MNRIDFVLTWVDCGDSVWRAEKRKWETSVKEDISKTDDANAECRYRSDDNVLRYWFRAVEMFAPWVDTIHFVTCGQKPDWLNENHPKLNLVNHEDYISSDYLPTFNSNVIELNYHRINALSEQFVLFNDDMFLLRPINEDFFFKNGNPVLDTDLRYTNYVGYNNWSRVVFNDYCVVNGSFDIFMSIKDNWNKWFNVKELGFKRVRRNFMSFLANHTLPVGVYGHIALPHLKSSLIELWERHLDIMEQTSKQRFRTDDQVNQWLLCAWNQAKGRFYPAHEERLGKFFIISPENIEDVCSVIRKQYVPQICVNDSEKNTNYDLCMKKIVEAFHTILPDKSSFEK